METTTRYAHRNPTLSVLYFASNISQRIHHLDPDLKPIRILPITCVGTISSEVFTPVETTTCCSHHNPTCRAFISLLIYLSTHPPTRSLSQTNRDSYYIYYIIYTTISTLYYLQHVKFFLPGNCRENNIPLPSSQPNPSFHHNPTLTLITTLTLHLTVTLFHCSTFELSHPHDPCIKTTGILTITRLEARNRK